VDILIVFTNIIFLSIFWLELWWDIVKHPDTHFVLVWWGWWVLAGWQKNGLNLKIPPKSVAFAPLDPPPKQASTFLIIIAKVRSSQTFLM